MFYKKKMLKKPKIAIIHPAIGYTYGGSQAFVLELAKRLQEKCEVTIFSGTKENNLCKPVFSLPRSSFNNDNSLYNIFYNIAKKYACQLLK
ncbi:MAG: hypothetical protein MZV70_76800 [Desulfobacterales bacterium]|nr:hypothetical protein [Desulfobacterales bacterium]